MAFLKPTLFPRISFISPPSPSSSPFSKLKDLNIRAPPLQARAAWTVFLLPSLRPYPAVSSSSLQSLAAQHTITDVDLPDLPLVLCTTHFLPYDPCPAMVTSCHQQLAPLSSAESSLSNVLFAALADPSGWRHLAILPAGQTQFNKTSFRTHFWFLCLKVSLPHRLWFPVPRSPRPPFSSFPIGWVIWFHGFLIHLGLLQTLRLIHHHFRRRRFWTSTLVFE